MLKEDFVFSYDALAKLEDFGINFMKIPSDDFLQIARFYWACCDDKYTKEEICEILHIEPFHYDNLLKKITSDEKTKPLKSLMGGKIL